MSKIKELIGNAGDDGTVSVKLHIGDLQALLDILEFTYTASRILSAQELDRGTAGGAIKMQRMSREAHALQTIIARHLDIGEPQSKDIN